MTSSTDQSGENRRAGDVIAAESSAPATTGSSPAAPAVRSTSPIRYLGLMVGLTLVGLAGVWAGNRAFAPEMYDHATAEQIADALAAGQNYALYDLNINIREIRDAQIARMKEAPEVAVLGASHWQEAHAELLPGKRFYNAHVHRDYYEDMLGVTEMFVRHDKLPRQMIIAIRDNLFMPIEKRKDYLWLPGIPYYRAMAARLGLKPHPMWQTLPTQRWRELASIQMLYGNAVRWYKSDARPHRTQDAMMPEMDLLLPGGSIIWSREHQRLFSPQRAEKLAAAFAEANRNQPPAIDPEGVVTIDKLLEYLKARNVDLVLAHPPFNPDFYKAIQGTSYLAGLKKVEDITRQLAQKHGLKIIGSFDPDKVGCDEDDYIDAEHGNPECLGKLLNQFLALYPASQQAGGPAVAAVPAEAGQEITATASKGRTETRQVAELVPSSATLAPAIPVSPAGEMKAVSDEGATDPHARSAAGKAARGPRAIAPRRADPGVHAGPAKRMTKSAAPRLSAAAHTSRKALAHCKPTHSAAKDAKSKSCAQVAGVHRVAR